MDLQKMASEFAAAILEVIRNASLEELTGVPEAEQRFNSCFKPIAKKKPAKKAKPQVKKPVKVVVKIPALKTLKPIKLDGRLEKVTPLKKAASSKKSVVKKSLKKAAKSVKRSRR